MPSIAPRQMPESLTESFCERCGTRYAFKAPTTLNPLRKARGLAAGLKNYVMSSDSMSEAVADAMHDETESVAERQRRAFDRIFSFCMTCRQYACANCWNPAAGNCLTCAPTDAVAGGPPVAETAWPDRDVAAAERLAELTGAPGPTEARAPVAESPRGARVVEDLVWPDVLPPLAPAEQTTPAETPAAASSELWVEATRTEDVAPVGEAEDEAAPVTHLESPSREEWPGADLSQVAERAEAVEEAVAAEAEEVMYVSSAEEVAAADATWTDDAVRADAPVYDDVHPTDTATDDVLIPFPERLAATVAPYPSPEADAPHVAEDVAAETQAPAITDLPEAEEAPAAIAEPAWPELVAPEVAEEPVAAIEETPEAAARREQLDVLGLGDPGRGPAPVNRPAPPPPLPVLPRVDDPERWIPREPAPSRVAATASGSQGGVAVAPVGVQDCSHCGLSLSASARFCRRCGQRQLRSA